MRSSSWSTSALMWTYDGWGGWYDHVPPPKVDSRGYGFRVPALLVSPYAKRGVVDHTVLDYTAMLKFIESNWQLAPLSTRDKQSAGLVSAFDFSSPARPPVLPALTWPGPQESLSAENPAPVIYSVYGVAAALAIMVLSLAFRRRPVAVPAAIGRAAVLVRSRFEALLKQPLRGLQTVQARGHSARRSGRFSGWKLANLVVPRWPRPAVATEGEESGASWSPEITRIPGGRSLVSIGPGGIHRAEANVSEVGPGMSTDGRPDAPEPEAENDSAGETEAATQAREAPEAQADTEAQEATEAESDAAGETEPAAEAQDAPEAQETNEAQADTSAEAEKQADAATASRAATNHRRRRNPNHNRNRRAKARRG